MTVPDGFAPRRIYVDPGHGAPGNPGNLGARCQREMDVMLSLAGDLARTLRATGHFTVRVGRAPGSLSDYPSRVREAEAWGAHALLSLHSDVRGPVVDVDGCPRSADNPGFTVIYHPRGRAPLVADRQRLARRVAGGLAGAGFPAYDGASYGERYGVDREVPGVFLDRRNLFMLRRPSLPSILIETHHAVHVDEANRWEERRTRDVFARVVLDALLD